MESIINMDIETKITNTIGLEPMEDTANTDKSSDNKIEDIVYQPLCYSGAKDRLISQIGRFLPQKINTFYDLFGGSFSLGININANKIIYNENDTNVFNIIKGLSKGIAEDHVQKILEAEDKYYDGVRGIKSKYLAKEEADLLKEEKKKKHEKLQSDYQSSAIKKWQDFYIGVIHSWASRINYNTKEVFDSYKGPLETSFNNTLQQKVLEYSKKLIEMGDKVEYSNESYEDFKHTDYKEDDVVYVDPAYSITDTDYVRIWNRKYGDKKLFDFLDDLNSKGVKFAMSNVFEMNGKTNETLIEWAKKYKVYYLDITYKSSDKSKIIDPETGKQAYPTVEVLVTNYGEGCNSPEVVAMYKENTDNIVQGAFFINDEVEQGNESYRLSQIAHEKYKASYEESLVYKCEWLVQRINLGKSIIIFKEKYEIQKMLDKKNGVKTQKYGEAIESAYNFDYETGRRAMNLAIDSRIAKLKVEDIMKFKKKSLDTLDSLKVLTDEEFDLFLEGKHELRTTRKIASSRQNPSSAENDIPIEDNTSNAPESVKMLPMAENNHLQDKQYIEELRAKITMQDALIAKQKSEIEKYKCLMSGQTIERFHHNNNTFNSFKKAS